MTVTERTWTEANDGKASVQGDSIRLKVNRRRWWWTYEVTSARWRFRWWSLSQLGVRGAVYTALRAHGFDHVVAKLLAPAMVESARDLAYVELELTDKEDGP